jgi:myo-inositol-1(or 4)-monophosphatase
MTVDRSPEAMLRIAVAACSAAGQRIAEQQVEPGSVRLTAHDGVTTNHDRAADREIRRSITACFPDDQILSEESEPSTAAIDFDRPLWIIDPVDGSSNRLWGHPSVGVSVAYAEGGHVLAGAVFAPFHNEMYSAARGCGSWCNGRRIAVSDVTELRQALVGTGLPHDRRQLDLVLRRFRLLGTHALDIRRSGSPTLDICWVAMGRLAAHVETLSPWDIAAADLIAREAGAVRISTTATTPPLPADLDGAGYGIAAPGIASELYQLLADLD